MSRYIKDLPLLMGLADWQMGEAPTERMTDAERHDAEIVYNTIDKVIKGIDAQPSADVVEVVRCKDCKWWDIADDEDMKECINNGGYWKADEFCSDAERRTDDLG